MTSVDLHFKSAILFLGPGADHRLADLCNRSQRLAAKPKSANAKQIIGIDNFAGRMTGNGQRQLRLRDPVTIVGNSNQFGAALLDREFDLG